LIEAIPHQPVTYMVFGLSAVILAVLVLPLCVKFVEHNLEPFFLLMGAVAVTISGLWSTAIVVEALKAPVVINSLPIGIFQVVLVLGLVIFFLNKPIYRGVAGLYGKLGPKPFIFLTILFLSLISSLISVIVTAVILAELIAILPFARDAKIKMAVVSCFAVGLGAVLTPLGEPLSTILVQKLSGAPYHAGFFFTVEHFALYVIPGVIVLAIFGAFFVGRNMSTKNIDTIPRYEEPLKSVFIRAFKVFVFVAALVLLGEGLKPLMVWYLADIPAWALYWINSLSAVLDNATMAAVEIGSTMQIAQIVFAIIGLLIAGGALIPGNIPNIVAAGRLKISMKEWAKIGVPIGMVLMVVYFIALIPRINAG
jgi:predicted cation transporter